MSNRIYDLTPTRQAILLKGIHGIGKSETVSSYWSERGYRVIPFFLGQMSDAGDVLGLPKISVVDGVEVTEFKLPIWWPRNPDEKVVLFLDELNRAKPELMQVIMDLVLNRKLAGKSLPNECRIIAAINPPEDSVYDVEDLNPALLDRFNIYDFQPSFDEWIDYATKKKLNKLVIGFCSRNTQHIDPPKGEALKSNTIYPSRRSWERVSEILDNVSDVRNDYEEIANILMGIVGTSATSKFLSYMRENDKGIHVGTLITKFKERREEFELKLSKMNIQDVISLNREIIFWFNDNAEIITGKNTSVASQYVNNLDMYLNAISVEAMAEFFQLLKAENATKAWPKSVFQLNRDIGMKMVDVIRGEKAKK
ncbi:MAG: AAA family ATPase [Fibrobacteres bacterium]|nr:AAA family ATPase [Fibrobacterota bacterium]